MKNIFKVLFIITVLLGSKGAFAGAFYFQYAGFEVGSWTYGCTAFQNANYIGAPYQYKINNCFVYAPASSGGVTLYGINHVGDGFSHYSGFAPFHGSQDSSQSWSYHGQVKDTTSTYPIVSHDTYGVMYWDEICENYYFYYQVGGAGYGLEYGALCEWSVNI
jgi:hypothetical protein